MGKNMRPADDFFDSRGMYAPLLGLPQRFRRFKRAGNIRKLPQAREQPLCRAAAYCDSPLAAKHEYRSLLAAARLFFRFDRVAHLRSAFLRAAERRQRTQAAFRLAVRLADRCAQLHQRLREIAAAPRGIDAPQLHRTPSADAFVRDRLVQTQQAAEYAQDISVHGGRRPFKADGADCAGRIRPDAGQRPDRVIIIRKGSVIL